MLFIRMSRDSYICSTANKGWSAVNYHQSLAFDCPYLSCNHHCDWWLFQEIFFYLYCFYFLEILLKDLELVFVEFIHIYKTQRSLFSFYLFIFTCCFVIIWCVNVLQSFYVIRLSNFCTWALSLKLTSKWTFYVI